MRGARCCAARATRSAAHRAPRSPGAPLLIAVAAAIALWQFRLYGSPLVTSSSGRVDVDPVAVLAPVLVLLALSLLALGLTGPVGAVLERLAAARPALVPALPMRQLARRAALYASASFVTMLAVAGLTLTAAFAGAWQSVDRQMSALTAGGEVRVAFAGRDIVRGPDPLALVDPFADVDGITADAPVFHGEVRLGSEPATLVAAPVGELAEVAPGVGAAATAGPLAASAEAAGVALPEGASTLGVDVTLQAPVGTAGRVAVSAWLLTEGGAATRTPAGEVEIAAGEGRVTIELPDAPGMRLIGLQASLVGASGADGVRVGLDGIGFDGTGPDGTRSTAVRPTSRSTARCCSRRPSPRPARTSRPVAATRCPSCSPTSSPRASRPRSATGSRSASSRAAPSSMPSSPAPCRWCPRRARTPCSPTWAR